MSKHTDESTNVDLQEEFDRLVAEDPFFAEIIQITRLNAQASNLSVQAFNGLANTLYTLKLRVDTLEHKLKEKENG